MPTHDSFQDFIDRTPDLVDYFYNDAKPAHASLAGGNPIPPAFTNWPDEQRAVFDGAALVHQTYYMPALFVRGPDALKLLRSVAVNSFENYGYDRGKQFVACSPSGHLIADCILYRHGEDSFELVSGAPVLNWVHYLAQTEGHDVEALLDQQFNLNTTGRRVRYRFELVGPAARQIFDRVVEGGAPDIPFFRMAKVRMNGHEVLALRHGMVGSFAVELSGPFEEQDAVRSHILKIGEEFGLKPMGMQACFSGIQSGWIPYPVPGLLTDPAMENYRRYLPSNTFEAGYELGGSFVSPDIGAYFATPYDYGYEKIIMFDHDFYGREALQRVPEEAKRRKVTLVWDRDDVLRVIRSQFGSGPRYKTINLPIINYAWKQYDEVRSRRGELIGLSLYAAYQNPLGEVLSLALVDGTVDAPVGSEVFITWGEPDGGSRKPQVERHEQTTIRARIAPLPYQADIQQAPGRTHG